MVGSRWIRRLVPGAAALGILGLVVSTTTGGRERGWDPPPCPGAPPVSAAAGGSAGSGVWYRFDPILVDGRTSAQRLVIGRAGAGRLRPMLLPAESFVAGPFGRSVLVGADDGARSTVRLIDVAGGCAWSVATSGEVIRRATVSPDGERLVMFRVARATRADLGVTTRALTAAGGERRLLDPIRPDPRFGPTWTTELAWSAEGDQLAVQSCGARACRTRVVDMPSQRVRTVAGTGLGEMVGLAAGRLVAHAACGGLPCALVSIPLAGGPTIALDGAAGQALMARDEAGRPVVVWESGADLQTIAVARVDGRRLARSTAADDAYRLVAGAARSGSAADVGPGFVFVAPDGRPPLHGPDGPAARRIRDGVVVTLEEVSR